MKRMIQWVVAATLVCGLTVFTACSKDDDSDTPAATQGKLVTLPQGVVSKGYTMQTVRTVNTIDGAQTVYEKKNVQAAFDGQDVYVSGFSSSFPESFVKGTLTSAGTCRFESGQYVGEDKTGEKYVVGIQSAVIAHVGVKEVFHLFPVLGSLFSDFVQCHNFFSSLISQQSFIQLCL